MNEKKFENVIAKIGLPAITRFTRTDKNLLKREFKIIKDRGFACDNQEMRIGVFRIASPVFDKENDIAACIGVAGPSFRLNNRKMLKLGGMIKEIADQLTQELKKL